MLITITLENHAQTSNAVYSGLFWYIQETVSPQ